MKLLNIDELVQVKREVQIKGQIYPVAERSVDQMLKSLAVAREIEKREAAGIKEEPEEIIASMIESVRDLVPTCPAEVIGSLAPVQLLALIQYANASDEELVEESVAADEAAPGEAAGK